MQDENDGCVILGCVLTPFFALFALLAYILIYGTVIAFGILVVITILEWFGVDCPEYRAPDWFGQEGIE